eukprot:TRINITY_DN99_c3_g1_i1.p1 TRINITY_DN99_c3_g1~~TRINITY_DN99_c3_g1_i1.p1  ORF type:complete len:476 (+),score=103.46 TRINITY_DN99_c3_g1_i1:49-1428(+)
MTSSSGSSSASSKKKEEKGQPAHKTNMAFIIVLLTIQIVFIVLYATVVSYGDHNDLNPTDPAIDDLNRIYPFYQDVHVMVFVGFGFLMTFLKKYSMSAVGFNLLIAATMLQWTILVVGFWHRAFNYHTDFSHKIDVGIKDLVAADFGAATVLISFGAVLGKAGPLQLIIMGLFEIIIYGLNESIGVVELQAVDMGGSMYVHMFGAFFGCAASFTFLNDSARKEKNGNDNEGGSRTTDTFAMIGTLFLWMFWPSFNGALAAGNARNRVVINTVLAISSSASCAFLFSYWMRGSGRFSMVDVQNATLAGGVAVGSSSDLVINAYPALIIGALAGMVSVAGYVYLQPALQKCGLHDTCGVLNLHGIPGMIGAISGAISAADTSSGHLATNFPARPHRSASHQGAMQATCMFVTLGISIGGGLLAGFVMRCIPDGVANDDEPLFEDSRYWELEEEEEGNSHPY